MREARAGLADVVDVEEHRTRDVAPIVILPRGRGDSRQFERGIDDPEIRVGEVGGKFHVVGGKNDGAAFVADLP